MVKFKKGELALYKDHSPVELKTLHKNLQEPKHLEYFLRNYEYVYTTKTWKKKGF